MSAGSRQYYTAAELAELNLPGLSRAKRKINERALDERWALKTDAAGMPLARPRQGRGGGLEYHLQLLPAAARLELVKRGLVGAVATDVDLNAQPAHCRSWAWLEAQSSAVKAEAQKRAAIVASVEAFEAGGLTRSAAIGCAAADAGIATSTIWNWLDLINGVERANRLPHLAPRRKGGGAEAAVDDDAWRFFLSDYLRPERPTLSSCYDRLVRDFAAPRGIEIPHRKTLQRKLEREVDGRVIIAKREGAEALRRTLPPQQRTVAGMHAMELVNIDGHKFDVFVRFADGRIGRPLMIATQDIYSRKILSWRIGETESAVLTRLAFADLFKTYGIPRGCLLDNGRAFASKWITGGAKTRFRFKIKEEEPTGLLIALGVKPHWATPHRGQSKPIERAFRDLCDTIAKHPAFAGAYTGNKPDAKPENYGSKAIPIDVFQAGVERGIAAHNAKQGRRTETARGVSFDAVFEASYQRSPIGRATEEQLRMALLMADETRADRQSGAITLHGNKYWSPEISALAGQKVTIRFDPDDLTLPVHVYDKAGRFLASAGVLAQTGFLDAASAGARARQEREIKKLIRRKEEILDLIDATDLAAMLPAHEDEEPVPMPTVLRPVRHRGQTAAALKHAQADEQPNPSFMDRFSDAVPRLRIVD
ncbi:MAG: transposase domain-containing protein [Sphingomicrobium sp.]